MRGYQFAKNTLRFTVATPSENASSRKKQSHQGDYVSVLEYDDGSASLNKQLVNLRLPKGVRLCAN